MLLRDPALCRPDQIRAGMLWMVNISGMELPVFFSRRRDSVKNSENDGKNTRLMAEGHPPPLVSLTMGTLSRLLFRMSDTISTQ